MKRALSLAAKGRGQTSPNPMVGAVVVNKGEVVGAGYHHRAGEPHAEILALRRAGSRARGGVLYVTLEPCCHTQKRTPPCVPLLIHSGLARVCVAMTDPNPEVSGRGVDALKRARMVVSVGVLEQEARHLNEIYVHWITTGYPFVILKSAMTLDGKIATSTGVSQWITGERARQDVHRLRRQVDAIMVGLGTVIRDDPELSARGIRRTAQSRIGKQPVRIVLDTRLRIPLKRKILQWTVEQSTIVCTTPLAPRKKIQLLQDRGIAVWVLPVQAGQVALKPCLRRAAKAGLTSILLEGGSRANASALQQGVINRVRLYVAPSLLGGEDAKSLIGGLSPKTLEQAWRLEDTQIKRLGEDWLVTGKLTRRPMR